ncbi:tegument protein [Murid herpesvirus 3]|uniref:Tegument protein n=2 Tax=Murid betaherpesvirus 3 TaxID=2560603 RepID=A0A1P8VIQ5_9BETA|nr:tegument protein [Murine roseolovirus]APZ76222.1 tegument protein [Murid betaherpesvirus 3]AYH64748.1 tegument protein [Murid herpesvirus 3]
MVVGTFDIRDTLPATLIISSPSCPCETDRYGTYGMYAVSWLPEELNKSMICAAEVVNTFKYGLNDEQLHDFLKKADGRRLALPWPVGSYLVFKDWKFPTVGGWVCSATAEPWMKWYRHILAQVCCSEDMVPLGFITDSVTATEPTSRRTYWVFYGVRTGTLYSSIPNYPGIGIWTIGANFNVLTTLGLVWMSSIYEDVTVSIAHRAFVDGCDIHEMKEPDFVKNFLSFIRSHEGEPYDLDYPSGFQFWFGTGITKTGDEDIILPNTKARATYIGWFGPTRFSGGGQLIVTGRVYIGSRCGSIYAKDEESKAIYQIASNVDHFICAGIRFFFENHQFAADDNLHKSVKCPVCEMYRQNRTSDQVNDRLKPRFT